VALLDLGKALLVNFTYFTLTGAEVYRKAFFETQVFFGRLRNHPYFFAQTLLAGTLLSNQNPGLDN